MFAALIAKAGLPLLFGRLKDALSIVPRWLWLTLAVVIALFASVLVHQHYAKKQLALAYSQGRADSDRDWASAFASMRKTSELWKQRYESRSDQITQNLGEQHETNLRDIASRADDMRLRGPGAAAADCRSSDHSRLSVVSGGQAETPTEPDAPRPGMPAGNGFAIVPWGWLVQRAEEHDSLLDEIRTVRTWHTEQDKLHGDAINELPEPQF